MAYYYLKLHHEILHDPKMGNMPDHLWRRCIEIFIIAGMQKAHDGTLPPLNEMAWLLHTSEEELEECLRELECLHVTAWDGEHWRVVNFEKRQASKDPTAAERQQRYRERFVTRDVTRDITRIVKNLDIDNKNIEEEEEGKNDTFTQMCQLANELTGLPTTQGDIATIREWVKNDVQEDDIRGALQWRIDNQRPPAKTIAQLAGGVETNRAMRLQVKSARPSKNGKQSAGPTARQLARQKLEEESA